MHPKMRQILDEADRHNANLKYKKRRKVREEIGGDIEREVHKMGSTSRIRNTCFMKIDWEDGQWENIFK